MKRLILAVAALALFAAGSVQGQPARPARPAPAAPAAAPVPEVPHEEVFMTMRDGLKLAANVYKPAGPGPWPVIVSRTPYLKDVASANATAKRYTDAGFVYVLQDVRGKGHSQGFYIPYNDDIPDGYDTIEWIAAQPWSTGKIGITGASAVGITANFAAIAAPPHLTAAFVIVAPQDRFDYSFMGGVAKERDTFGWMRGQGVTDEAINALRSRPVHDVFWQRNDLSQGLRYVRIPIYNVGGWYDIFDNGNTSNFTYLQNQGADGARGNQKLLMGPFGHGPLSGDLAYPGVDSIGDNTGEDIRWFNYWLKGEENGIMDEPPVRYFMMASARKGAFSPLNRWISAANWPPASRGVRYYPSADGGLSTTAPSIGLSRLAYRFDPANPVPTFGGANLTFERGPMDQRAVGQRQDYLRFQTPVLTQEVAIAGKVSVEVWAATDGPDTDFVAKLIDVYPDGYEALVLDAPIRARYRNGRGPDQAMPMTPGKPEKMVIDLWQTAITFERGHRIMLVITSSNSQRFEVNPNTGEAPGLSTLPPRVATNTVYFDRDHPTALVLPVIYFPAAPAPAAPTPRGRR
ncbi:MAG: CocE/NonD family hydrolase [Caulobacteraceae bacterium]